MSGAAPSLSVSIPAPDPVPRLLRDLVHERTGIYFDDERFGTLLEKLEDRVRELNCPSYLEYYYVLKYDEHGPSEWKRVMDAFSVQETYFWRESDQIQALVHHIVPAWFKTSMAPLRIWSAACATGEEPYSLAIALREGGWSGHPIEIVATDGSEAALAKARGGLYRERSFRALPASLREKYFTAGPRGYQLDRSILERVHFHYANLVNPTDTLPFSGAQCIYCRNVFIYFSQAAITRVVAGFADHMPGGGHLFVGSSESLLKLTTEFELAEIDGAFVYVRKPRR
jgi:chemotaxis protein methyltransferase CheR